MWWPLFFSPCLGKFSRSYYIIFLNFSYDLNTLSCKNNNDDNKKWIIIVTWTEWLSCARGHSVLYEMVSNLSRADILVSCQHPRAQGLLRSGEVNSSHHPAQPTWPVKPRARQACAPSQERPLRSSAHRPLPCRPSREPACLCLLRIHGPHRKLISSLRCLLYYQENMLIIPSILDYDH